MKNRIKAIITTLALSAITSSVAYAKSELTSISVTPMWPTNSNPGNVTLYRVTVERAGQGMLQVALTCTGLPAGSTASFANVRFTGNNPKVQSFIMAVTSPEPTPTDLSAFVVTGTARNETISVTNATVARALASVVPSETKIISLDLSQGSSVQLRGLGNTGEGYQIETNTDLNNPTWTDLGPCTADGNGRFTFVHSNAQSPSTTMRFYRTAKSTNTP